MEKEWKYFYSGAWKYLEKAKKNHGDLREGYLGAAESCKEILKLNLNEFSKKLNEQDFEKINSDLENLSLAINKEVSFI